MSVTERESSLIAEAAARHLHGAYAKPLIALLQERGPMRTGLVARETGFPLRSVSASLRGLYERGVLERWSTEGGAGGEHIYGIATRTKAKSKPTPRAPRKMRQRVVKPLPDPVEIPPSPAQVAARVLEVRDLAQHALRHPAPFLAQNAAIAACGTASRVYQTQGACPLKQALDNLEHALWRLGTERSTRHCGEAAAAFVRFLKCAGLASQPLPTSGQEGA